MVALGTCGLARAEKKAFRHNSLDATVGISANVDNNIADNSTHVSEHWFVPSLETSYQYQWNKRQGMDFSVVLQAENSVQERSATLNAPIDQYTLRYSHEFKGDLKAESGARWARTVDSKYEPVKYLYRLFAGGEWSPGPLAFNLDFRGDWENYGDHAQDGNTRWLLANAGWKIRKQIFAGLGYSLEDRQAFSPGYTYNEHLFSTELRFTSASHWTVTGVAKGGWKDYANAKQNWSWQLGMRATVAMGDWKLKWKSAGEETKSNRPGYSWSQRTAETSLTWSPGIKW